MRNTGRTDHLDHTRITDEPDFSYLENPRAAVPLSHAVEVVRSLLLKGGIDEAGCVVVQGNIALNYEKYRVADRPFLAVIATAILDGFREVPRPDLIEAVALEIGRMAIAGFDDMAELASAERAA